MGRGGRHAEKLRLPLFAIAFEPLSPRSAGGEKLGGRVRLRPQQPSVRALP